MLPSRILSSLTILVAVQAIPAQTTWIVDAANGPGTNFTNIPPAIAAAQSGDKIVVRSGTYSGGTIDKGIWLLAEPGATVVLDNFSFTGATTLAVSGVPAGQTVVLSGLRAPGFSLGIPDPFLRINNCAGRVHVAECTIDLSRFAFTTRPDSIRVTNSVHVTIHDTTIAGTMRVNGSNVVLSDSSVVGLQADDTSCLGGTNGIVATASGGDPESDQRARGSGHFHVPLWHVAQRQRALALVFRGDHRRRCEHGDRCIGRVRYHRGGSASEPRHHRADQRDPAAHSLDVRLGWRPGG